MKEKYYPFYYQKKYSEYGHLKRCILNYLIPDNRMSFFMNLTKY